MNFTSPELPSDTGGVVRGCLSGSPGLNSELLISPASDEEEEDGVLLLLLYMIFSSLNFPVPFNYLASDTNKHTDQISGGR